MIFHYKDLEDEFSMIHQRTPMHTMNKSHFHSSHELYYLLEGEREFFIGDRRIKMVGGEMMLIHPNVLHRTGDGAQREHEKIIVNFRDSFVTGFKGNLLASVNPELKKDYVLIGLTREMEHKMRDLLYSMLEEVKRENGGLEVYQQALLIQILVLLSRFADEHNQEPQEHLSLKHERIGEIVRYIHDHYMDTLTLATIAEKFYMSTSYLSRSFKEVTEYSFVEYVNHIRIKEAIELLMNTSLKSYRISQKVGFNNVTHYRRVFKKVTGHSPYYYRNEHRVNS